LTRNRLPFPIDPQRDRDPRAFFGARTGASVKQPVRGQQRVEEDPLLEFPSAGSFEAAARTMADPLRFSRETR